MASTLPVLPNLKTRPVDPEAVPYLMVGAASPLWLMFGGAAAAKGHESKTLGIKSAFNTN